MKNDVIAIVGGGNAGKAILSTLLRIPGISIKFVCDILEDAPALKLARSKKIPCYTDNILPLIEAGSDVDLIFEVTGRQEVFEQISAIKPSQTKLMGPLETKIIFHLLEAQDKTNQKLEKYKEGLEEKIIERTEDLEKSNMALQDQIIEYEGLNAQLQQLNNEKTKYLLHATHQLKAPFAAIQNYVDIILGGYTGDITPQTSEILEKIKVRCESLTEAIKEMLELANLKSCIKDNIIMQPIQINELLPKIVDEHRALADKSDIQIVFSLLPVKRINIWGNTEQLTILFSIIIQNAINYSNPGSKIEIVLDSSSGQEIKIRIIDHGIGIPKENISKIFNEYFRSNNAVKKYENGSGIGLAIAKQITNLHSFHLDVESELNKGSTFTITAPLYKDK